MPTVPTTTGQSDPLAALKRFGSPESLANSRLSVLFKGHSDAGKTRAALTFPGPVALIYGDVNRETVRKMAQLGVEIDGYVIDSWKDFSDVLVPHIVQRKLKVNTVVVDTIDFLADLMWREIQGSAKNLTQQDFGTGLRRLGEITRALVTCTMPVGDHPGYHVVFTSHLKDVTDDKGALLRVAPALMGQFSNKIEAYFDYVLLMRGETASSIENVNGQQKAVPKKQFKAYTISPDKFNTCKSGDMPAEIVIPDQASAFEVFNEYWKVEVTGEATS